MSGIGVTPFLLSFLFISSSLPLYFWESDSTLLVVPILPVALLCIWFVPGRTLCSSGVICTVV